MYSFSCTLMEFSMFCRLLKFQITHAILGTVLTGVKHQLFSGNIHNNINKKIKRKICILH